MSADFYFFYRFKEDRFNSYRLLAKQFELNTIEKN
jgi:hypothetical protein